MPKKQNEYGLKVTPQDVQEALDTLQEYVTERKALLETDKIQDAQEAVKFMAAMKDFTEKVQKQVKAPAEILYNTARFSMVPNIFEATDTVKISVDGIGRCNLNDDIAVNVVDKPALHNWLTENGLEDIIVDQVNAQTLAAQLRGRIKENAAVTARAIKSGVMDPTALQNLPDLKALPPKHIVEIKPVVRAQITKE